MNYFNIKEEIDKIKDKYHEIIELCKVDKLKTAVKQLKELEEYIETVKTQLNDEEIGGESNSAKSTELSELIQSLNSDGRLNQLKMESKEIDELLDLLQPDFKSIGWNQISHSQGILSLYRDNGHGMHSIRMEGIIESPIFNICSVILEIDLYDKWIPRLLESNILEQDTRYKRLIYCKTSCPWPVADRDICLYGYGVDMLDDYDQVVVVSRSVKENDFCKNGLSVELPKVPEKVVRCQTQISGFVLKPISKTQTFVQVISLTDPCMQYIPYWLLNMVTNQFCHHLFVMLRKQSEKVSTCKEYQKRIASNPLYKEIKEKAESYFIKSSQYEI
eukprot:gene7673-9440_t